MPVTYYRIHWYPTAKHNIYKNMYSNPKISQKNVVFMFTCAWKRKSNAFELVHRTYMLHRRGVGYSSNDPHVGFRVLKRFPFGLRDMYNTYVTPTTLYTRWYAIHAAHVVHIFNFNPRARWNCACYFFSTSSFFQNFLSKVIFIVFIVVLTHEMIYCCKQLFSYKIFRAV